MKLLLSKLIAFGITWPHCWQVQYLCTPTNIKILLLRVSFHIQNKVCTALLTLLFTTLWQWCHNLVINLFLTLYEPCHKAVTRLWQGYEQCKIKLLVWLVEIWWAVTLGSQHYMHPYTTHAMYMYRGHCIVDIHLTYQ